MFYQMITHARDRWLGSPDCTVGDLLRYIEQTGQLRDAQIDAIKTYLFLKIRHGCRPLSALFAEGAFNTADIGELFLPERVKVYLRANPAAAALLEYASLKNDKGEQVSKQLAEQIAFEPDSIDYQKFFRDVFYGVSYTEYLFSLPMGAGKTYLMAAFIYLDLYFAEKERQNPTFAHNFVILAPSGLKSSVIPSLKTIQKFDPTWVIPEPAASRIKHMIAFEVLDQAKTAKKSNQIENPNAQKIANHQPLDEAFGLVVVTNAEKVILDRIQEQSGQISFYEESDDEKDRQANELRSLIGKLPSLSVFIDEVHHAESDENKLRAVVNRWAAARRVNSVVGFSGTPYLEKPEKTVVTDTLSVATAEITNIVYYYPITLGVGNFLKFPVIKIADIADSTRIVENGVREFLDTYLDTVYRDGTTAKLGIYCGSIEKLEETVYPLVSKIAGEYGLSRDAILRFHRGSSDKRYPQPADSQMQFDILDKPLSKVRIVLLVQIGKEGWDCRSLTGIILIQESKCPKNMVLQTSCRCLRQVDKGQPEMALIYLNQANGKNLEAQLKQQHHISLKEFEDTNNNKISSLKRYDRTGYLKLPKVEFYQLKVNYTTTVTSEADPAADIPRACAGAEAVRGKTITTDLTMMPLLPELDEEERGTVPAAFEAWLYGIARSSFGTLALGQLQEHREALRRVFGQITYARDGGRYFSSRYDRAAVEANIRKAFCSKRTCITKEELVPEEASLLNIANFQTVIYTDSPDVYYPGQDKVKRIILDDQGKLKMEPKIQQTILDWEKTDNPGLRKAAETLRAANSSHAQKDRSFHYLPYHTDSGFERKFMDEILPFLDDPTVKALGLELYYNGDQTLTEFHIRCYKSAGGRYRYVGMYTPDFLILQRREGKIYKVLIVETKGELYANDQKFKDKREFTEKEFVPRNNAKFGYERFEYLYLEDTVPEAERLRMVKDKVQAFF